MSTYIVAPLVGAGDVYLPFVNLIFLVDWLSLTSIWDKYTYIHKRHLAKEKTLNNMCKKHKDIRVDS